MYRKSKNGYPPGAVALPPRPSRSAGCDFPPPLRAASSRSVTRSGDWAAQEHSSRHVQRCAALSPAVVNRRLRRSGNRLVSFSSLQPMGEPPPAPPPRFCGAAQDCEGPAAIADGVARFSPSRYALSGVRFGIKVSDSNCKLRIDLCKLIAPNLQRSICNCRPVLRPI